MKLPPLYVLVLLFVMSALMLVLCFYLLANFKRLFRGIKIELLRKNIIVWMIACCLLLALAPISGEYYMLHTVKQWLLTIGKDILKASILALFVFNCTQLVLSNKWVKNSPFKRRMGLALATIILSAMLIAGVVTYIDKGGSFQNIHTVLLYYFYNSAVAGLIYVTMSYLDLERERKMNEKELEVSRLQQLKTKAELDALHSKVNPHFLYNALNSIADLSITDGKKARRMTIALADLFRYSINYSHNNYSTVNDEVAMTEVYLQIEKIRFEDQLTYSVNVEENMGHYLVPRFILQPLVENAVKHGLKVTGRMTEIFLEVKIEGTGLVINIVDNGPPFSEEMMPGYGVKSVFDKMDLLFPGQYEIHFSNEPRKQVAIHLYKLIKNEPAV